MGTLDRNDERDGDERGQNYSSFDNMESSSDYRGFSTSINDMFTHPEFERVDCCSLACCGILQSDRNRYLITGITPPSFYRRFGVHIMAPLWMFALAIACALNVPDPFLNQVLSTGFVFCLLSYFIIQCCKGTWKRKDVRRELLWSKHNFNSTGHFRQRSADEDSVGDDSHDTENLDHLLGQTKSDMNNSHRICGCYVTDRPASYRFQDNNKRTICSKFFHCFTTSCCGAMCRMHLQLCGMCGVAQESRQLEMLLPEGYRQIDYITMQPVMEYYPAIYRARHGEDDSSSRWQRLSKLSKIILRFCAGVSAVLFVWSCISPLIHHGFGFPSFLVFAATVFQAVGFLTLVHWNHTQDISVDALVKYFASGFCLGTSLAVFFELAVGLTIRLIMKALIAMSGVEVVEENGYSMTSSGFANLIAMDTTLSASATYREYVKAYGKDHPVVYAMYLLVTSFFLAAMIEELCKYFGFRMVDHPDFQSRRKLEEASECHDDENHQENTFAQQDRSMESKGAATTVAMVATALGFACCENFIYVFIYSGSTPGMQIGVLLARSLLPVHPIAAAIQSVRVCQRDLEKDERMRLGRIILPSVIFHGTYDFLLMWIDFMYELNGNYIMDDDEAFSDEGNADLVSVLVALFVIFCGCCFYIRNSRQQRERLRALDRGESIDDSRLI
jgi:RsiW-degrading membrane proteinase PrsW (M82 family)